VKNFLQGKTSWPKFKWKPEFTHNVTRSDTMKKPNSNIKTLCALLFSSAVLFSAPSAVFANEPFTVPVAKTVGAVTVDGQVDPEVDVETTSGKHDGDPQTSAGKVNINLASYAQLVALPGIGRVKATAIIKYRKEVGLFATLADVQNVKGIGEKLFARLQNKIMI
jgi:competence protein ComEA